MVMVIHPPSSNDRQHNGRSTASGAHGRVERTPGTPRSRDPHMAKEKALQDPGLKDYRLGECLGKGAFGSVYKGINWGTGEAVAIKQVRIADLPRSELRMIEAEIDLLKNLNHTNIVKYLGFVKSPECLNIILEFCENGSLHSICKNYGKFPENLVGVYMAQILQGLLYLHDQGVIHRDIKGANILTTKDGTVKLADFGVSTSTLATGDKEAQVVGTPYWMAPEVIQLSGATTASDIWSLGCTVIELLDGKPPYHKLAPMPALFAIVNDDHPPLPEGVSPAAQDFLMQCFQKDPRLRVSARKLLKHAWVVGSRRNDAPAPKPPASFSQAVDEVKQWNEALKSPTNNGSLRTSARSNAASPLPVRRDQPLRNVQNEQLPIITPARAPPMLATSRMSAEAFRSPENHGEDNWDDDFATSISPSALHLPHLKPHDNFGGMFSSDRLKSFASADTTNENWEDSFEGDLITIKPQHKFRDPELLDMETIRPSPRCKISGDIEGGDPLGSSSHEQIIPFPRTQKIASNPKSTSKFAIPLRPAEMFREASVEDYSDLFVDNVVIDRRLNVSSKDEAMSPKLFHPSDLQNFPKFGHTAPAHGSVRRNAKPQGLRESLQRTSSALEIQRYAEVAEDDDFSDLFARDAGDSIHTSSDGDADENALMLHSKLSNSSWLGDEDDEDDPFASLEQGFDEMDLQANIARDKHARLATMVEGIVSSLKTTQAEDVLDDLSEELLEVLLESPESKAMVLNAHGMLPILEILEPCNVQSRPSMVLRFLRVVNQIIDDAQETQENLCFVGGIPIITKFTAKQYPAEIRMEAAAFVRQMYTTSTLTLQMFVSAGGLNVLVEFLDEDYEDAWDLVLIGVNGIWSVFELQGPTPKNDFCRIFSRSKILYSLSLVLSKVLDEDGDYSDLIEGRIVNIFYLFSQAENYVKEVVADRMTLKGVLKDVKRMSPHHQITMLKFIKNLSMLSTTLDALHSSNAIEVLIALLDRSMDKESPHVREITNQVANTMYNLCRLSKVRQEDAAVNGVIPLLKRIMARDRPPKEFALPILCDMAHSGKIGRKHLWQNRGLQFYISLLADQYWQVTALDAIFIWLQEETARVERNLLDGPFTEAIVSCFNTPKATAFDPNLLEPLQKLLRLSPPVAASLARQDMFSAILQKLANRKAVIRLNLLRIVRSICEPTATDGHSSGITIRLHGMFATIEQLADNDPAVLVRNMAGELVKLTLEREAENAVPSGGRRQSTFQRNGSYTSPTLLHGSSVPGTPTQRSRTRDSLYPITNMTPRRSNISTDFVTDHHLYQPRSKDKNETHNSFSPAISNAAPPLSFASGNSADMALAEGTAKNSKLPRTSVSRVATRGLGTSSAKTQAENKPSLARSGSRATAAGPPPASPRRNAPTINSNGKGHGIALRARPSETARGSSMTNSALAGPLSPALSTASLGSAQSNVSGTSGTSGASMASITHDITSSHIPRDAAKMTAVANGSSRGGSASAGGRTSTSASTAPATGRQRNVRQPSSREIKWS